MIVQRWIAPLVLVMVLALTAGAERVTSAEEPYEIPVMLSLTGPIAFVGKSCAETLRALEAYVNRTGGIRGRPLHLTISDMQSNPTVAVALANQVLAKHPVVMFGPEFGAAVNAIQPLLKEQTVLYAFSSTAQPISGGYVFTSGLNSFNLQLAALRYMRFRGVKRLAVLSSSDGAGSDLLLGLETALRVPENQSITEVDGERFAGTDLDVSAQLSRIRTLNPDFLVVNTAGTPLATVLRNYNDAGLTVPIMTNAANVLRVQMDQYASILPKELYFSGPLRFMAHDVSRPGPVKDAQRVFYEATRAYGIPKADIGTNLAWDGSWTVINALRALGPSATASQLHAYLMNLHGFAVTNGLMDFRDGTMRGVGLNAAMIVKWDAAKVDWVPVSEPGTGVPLK